MEPVAASVKQKAGGSEPPPVTPVADALIDRPNPEERDEPPKGDHIPIVDPGRPGIKLQPRC
jgi:hypothetical protein